jgi:Zn-dependent protease
MIGGGGDLETFLYLAPIILVSLVLHELAHALVATWFGDPTPREDGRLTLNPIHHLDPAGTLMLVLTYFAAGFMFGWARPVMVNTYGMRHPRQKMAVIAVAGPLVNFALAVLFYAVLVHGGLEPFSRAWTVVLLAYSLNLSLMIFNLLPIPPLDGSRVVAAAMNEQTYAHWRRLDEYGILILFGVIFLFRRPWNEFMGSLLRHGADLINWLVG